MSGVPPEARSACLTRPERIWVYNIVLFLSGYAAAAAITAVLAGAHGWQDASFSPWATLTIIIVLAAWVHLFGWWLEVPELALDETIRCEHLLRLRAPRAAVPSFSAAPRRSERHMDPGVSVLRQSDLVQARAEHSQRASGERMS